jgi:hypothetical protein
MITHLKNLCAFTMLVPVMVPQARARWVRTNGPYGGNVGAIVFVDNTAFAGTGNGLFASTNDGLTWTNPAVVALPATWINAAVVVDSNLIIGTFDGIFRSTDKGGHWQTGAHYIISGANSLRTHKAGLPEQFFPFYRSDAIRRSCSFQEIPCASLVGLSGSNTTL